MLTVKKEGPGREAARSVCGKGSLRLTERAREDCQRQGLEQSMHSIFSLEDWCREQRRQGGFSSRHSHTSTIKSSNFRSLIIAHSCSKTFNGFPLLKDAITTSRQRNKQQQNLLILAVWGLAPIILPILHSTYLWSHPGVCSCSVSLFLFFLPSESAPLPLTFKHCHFPKPSLMAHLGISLFAPNSYVIYDGKFLKERTPCLSSLHPRT